MPGIAAEYVYALGRPIAYVDAPFDHWSDQELGRCNLPEHFFEHFLTVASLLLRLGAHLERVPIRSDHLSRVMPALVAGIHVFLAGFQPGRRGWPGQARP